MNDENLIPIRQRTPKERREITSKAGKASVIARRKKKLMSEIYGRFLANVYDVEIDGEMVRATGERLVEAVVKQVLESGGSAAVSLMKEIREATEGSKIVGEDGGPLAIIIRKVSDA